MDRARGSTIKGFSTVSDRILEITVPEVVAESFAEGGTLSHSRHRPASATQADVNEYRDMVEIAATAWPAWWDEAPLEQIKAANPLIDYDSALQTFRRGQTSCTWTRCMRR